MEYADGSMPRRRAVGGRATDQYNLAQRDPMVHMIKGQLAAEKAMEGRGTTAQMYRTLQNQSHAHMRGGVGSVTGGAMTGGRPSTTGGAMYTKKELEGLARAVGGAKRLSAKHAEMVTNIRGAGFWDDFKSGFMSVVRPVASIAKPLLPMVAGPYGAAASAGLSALGLGRSEDMDEESESEMEGGRPQLAGGRRKRASAGPNDARRKRGAMVSKLMREKGMSLGEASRYIKEHGGV